ncbi:hypothetical protein RhiirC2_779215 [Rhizophagus irregularis]|uniref:Uncharacterized protein n=1 Tax=Rhizophagus irregularis TaxID=588596 RepID=A0A2N1NAH7_9GLOM|nr:hypothetical protein RhiirC2_779215 [Rhizophagus irregularis]
MMMELSKSISEIKNEIKEKVGNRSHYNGRGNRLPIVAIHQPQPAQFNQPVNTNGVNNLNTNNNDLIALLVQHCASSEGKDMEPNGNPSRNEAYSAEKSNKSIPGPVMIENDQQLQQSVEDINKAKINLTQWSKILNIHRHESSLDN